MQKLFGTDSGHYYVPLTKAPLQECLEVLIISVNKKNRKEKLKIAGKLLCQFSHPSGFKLASLARNAGVRDREFLKILEKFPSTCDICLTYKKQNHDP